MTYPGDICQEGTLAYIFAVAMRKDTRLTFRVESELKKTIETIAQTEGQSVARICEAFLLAGSEEYGKRGAKFLVRYIGRTRGSSPH